MSEQTLSEAARELVDAVQLYVRLSDAGEGVIEEIEAYDRMARLLDAYRAAEQKEKQAMTDLPSDEAVKYLSLHCVDELQPHERIDDKLRQIIHAYHTRTDEGRALVRDAERERLRRRETDHITLRVDL